MVPLRFSVPQTAAYPVREHAGDNQPAPNLPIPEAPAAGIPEARAARPTRVVIDAEAESPSGLAYSRPKRRRSSFSFSLARSLAVSLATASLAAACSVRSAAESTRRAMLSLRRLRSSNALRDKNPQIQPTRNATAASNIRFISLCDRLGSCPRQLG